MACCCPSLLADAKHLREADITRGKVRLAFAPHAHGLELCDLGVRKRAWTGGRPFRSKGAGNALCLPSPEFDVRVSPVDAGQSILVGISPTRGERKGTPEAESGAGAARTSRELAYVTTRRPHVCRAHHLPLHIARLVRTEKRPPLPSMQHQTMIGAGPMQFVFPDALATREKKEKQTRS